MFEEVAGSVIFHPANGIDDTAVAQVQATLHALVGEGLQIGQMESLMREHCPHWRNRIYPALTTVSLFLEQVLGADADPWGGSSENTAPTRPGGNQSDHPSRPDAPNLARGCA